MLPSAWPVNSKPPAVVIEPLFSSPTPCFCQTILLVVTSIADSVWVIEAPSGEVIVVPTYLRPGTYSTGLLANARSCSLPVTYRYPVFGLYDVGLNSDPPLA